LVSLNRREESAATDKQAPARHHYYNQPIDQALTGIDRRNHSESHHRAVLEMDALVAEEKNLHV